MVSYQSNNVVDIIIDEIALEGLDGITFEALWQRLSLRLHDPLPFSESFVNQVWSICLEVEGLDYFKLENPRKKLTIFDRYEFVDPDLGTILEPDDVPEDIYPHFPIDDMTTGIRGSCSTYQSRKNVTEYVKTLSLRQAVDEFGQSLVIVASQEIREEALTGVEVCPTLELTVMQYCFLERVGRSRYQGEVTQGKISLGLLKEDPKSLFYHRKFLLDHKLITKQIHHQRTAGHSCSGSLLHLPRFFVERKPKVIYLAEQVIEILKTKENCVAEYDEIRRELQIESSIKKLFKTAFFQKVVKTDLRVPYRTVYPKAEDKEWQQKNNPTREKSVRVVQLLDPDMDVTELWGKDEINDDEEPFELDISKLKLNVPLLKQANRMVELSGREGISQCQLAQSMGQTKLQARTMLRNLVKLKIVATYMNDIGRQRVTKFVSKRFEKSSEMSKQFEQEMDKIKELTKMIDVERTTKISESPREANVQTASTELPSKPEKTAEFTVTEVINVEETLHTKSLKMKLTRVNQILRKYGLTKMRNKYKRTFLNVADNGSSKKTPALRPLKTKDLQDDRTRITEEILEKQSKRVPNLKPVDQEEVITFYDSIEVKLVEQRPQYPIGRPASEVVGFVEDLHINERKNVSSITYRLLRRANMIIESVKEHKVIDDLTKLIKMINEEEEKEGYDVKIDKKSIIRLLQKLAKDNLIKNIKLTLKAYDREKILTFICDPTIGIEHTVIQSAIEQAKIKFCLLGAHKVRGLIQKPRKDENPAVANELNKGLEAFNSSKTAKYTAVNLKYDFKAGKRYGYSPKFVRMQMLHIFLFYSIYDHPGEAALPKEVHVANLRKNGYQIDAKLEAEMSTIYNTEVGWKMFIPPLTRHAGWPLGWTIMCDVLLRMPLSIFVKIHNVPFFMPELVAYLNHPIRKHFLVKNLPSQIRNTLLVARKYIYNIHDSVTRLCYIGLVQFGPQKLKEKDQVFIYVNRKSEITDTTSSAAGYHRIEDKEYPKTSYDFESLQVVEKYWYDMWNTCINTYLGGRLVVQGKDIVLEDLGKKAEMMQAVKARTPQQALELDNGLVPGDHRGAAGVDSAFFAHLKRNWNWGSHYTHQTYSKCDERKKEDQQRRAHLSKIKAKPLKFTEFAGLKKVTGPVTQQATELRKKLHQRQKNEEKRLKQQKYQVLVSQHVTKQKSFVRRVLPRKRKLRPRVKYDEVDFCALQQMEKLRVDWNPHEDNILLMCKVAMMYLCPNPRKQLITFTAVRDVLRTYSSNSSNKTSRACQRRLLYMFRKPQTVNSVALGVEEIKQNFYINKRFGGIVERLKAECQDPYEYEEEVAKVFKELVTYIDKRYYNISDMESRDSVLVPKTIQEFNLVYKLKHPTQQSSLHGFTKDIKTKEGIHSATINSVIHSSMCCGKDRTSWAYQLFRVYQQYPESLLRSAMSRIRTDQMVSVKKSYMCAMKKYGNCMPMSSSQYQLSTGYVYKFQTKWPYEVFNEAFQMLCRFAQWQQDNQSEELNYAIPANVDWMEPGHVTGGLVVGIHDYLTRGQIDFDIEIPDQIIMLHPRLKEKDETYLRIAQRYQDILTSLDQLNLKKTQAEGSNLIDPEVEEEDEMERREFEDKIVIEKREKEDRDRRDYWKSRNDEIGKRLEETEIKLQRAKEDVERKQRRNDFDNKMILRKQKYAQVLEFGEENLPEAIVSEFRNSEEDKAESESDQDENYDVDEDLDNHIIRFQDGTTITLTKEDVQNSASDSEHEEDPENLKRRRDSNGECPDNERLKACIEESQKYSEDVSASGTSLNQQNESETVSKKRQLERLEEGGAAKRVRLETWKAESLTSRNKDTADSESADKKRNTDGSAPNGTRVNELISRKFDQIGVECGGNKIEEMNDTQKRSTRIALLMMREELNDLALSDSHHAHDYFVVNTFKIFTALKLSDNGDERRLDSFHGFRVPVDILPLKTHLADELIDDVKRFALFPKDHVDLEDVKNTLRPRIEADLLDDMRTVYKWVREKREVGATSKQILAKFRTTSKDRLHRVVSLLSEHRLFLRSGVTTVRYIHQRFTDPWLIHSFKILRREREAMPPLSDCSLLLGRDEDKTVEEMMNLDQPDKGESKKLEIEIPEDNEAGEKLNQGILSPSNENEGNISNSKRRMQRKRTALLQPKDIQKAAKQLDFNTLEAIKVVIKPWIRIDGVLNRRVLDRMLGAVLSYCINHPGIILSKVQRRFMPALQPFHTTELVEMLLRLECVVTRALLKPKVTLFSKPMKTTLASPSGLDSEDELIIEAAIDASIKFGMFLGNKVYTSDFLN